MVSPRIRSSFLFSEKGPLDKVWKLQEASVSYDLSDYKRLLGTAYK